MIPSKPKAVRQPRRLLASVMSALLVTLSMGVATPAHAAAGNGSHGGSIVFVKGKWELADMFISTGGPVDSLVPSDEMVTYLSAIRDMAQRYDVQSDHFWKDLVLGDRVDYRYVTELPCSDEPLALPDADLKQESFGCTKDGITYLLKERFERLAFSSRALALVHERLHVFAPDINHSVIARFIWGLGTAIRIQEEQNAGTWRRLSALELSALDEIALSGRKLGFESFYISRISGPRHQVQAVAQGGGVWVSDGQENARPCLDAKSFLGIGSVLFLVKDGAECSLSNSKLIDSELYGFHLKDTEAVRSSMVTEGYVFNPRSGRISQSVVTDSILLYGPISIESSRVSRSAIYYGSVVKSSSVERSRFSDAIALEGLTVSRCVNAVGDVLPKCAPDDQGQ